MDDERQDIIDELTDKVRECVELAEMLGRGYREDQILHSLAGTESEFLGDGILDWLRELKEGDDDGDDSRLS